MLLEGSSTIRWRSSLPPVSKGHLLSLPLAKTMSSNPECQELFLSPSLRRSARFRFFFCERAGAARQALPGGSPLRASFPARGWNSQLTGRSVSSAFRRVVARLLFGRTQRRAARPAIARWPLAALYFFQTSFFLESISSRRLWACNPDVIASVFSSPIFEQGGPLPPGQGPPRPFSV